MTKNNDKLRPQKHVPTAAGFIILVLFPITPKKSTLPCSHYSPIKERKQIKTQKSLTNTNFQGS